MGKAARLYRIGWVIGVTLLLAIVLVEVYALIMGETKGDSRLPATFGNFASVRRLLGRIGGDGSFSFAVVGDTQARATYKRLADILKEEKLAFLVLLGDCVRRGRQRDHRFLRAKLAQELYLPFPTFYVVGNHDISEDGFSLDEFERWYGPTNFSFAYGGCLFVFLRILDRREYPTRESIGYLRSVLSDRVRYKKVFIFMHIPPPVSPDIVARRFDGADELISLCERHGIDYVIAADYHGYARVHHGKTTYLVTGGGGGRLFRRPGNFHHAVVITVGPDRVSERIIAVAAARDLEGSLEYWAIADVYWWMYEHAWMTVAINIGVLFGILLLLRLTNLHYLGGWDTGG